MRFVQQEVERVVPGSQADEGMGVETVEPVGDVEEEGTGMDGGADVDDEAGRNADLPLGDGSGGEDFEMLPEDEDSEMDFELMDGPSGEGSCGIAKSKRKRGVELPE